MYRSKIPRETLKRLYTKNDVYAATHVFIHTALFLSLFYLSFIHFTHDNYILGFLFMLFVGFVGNFFGWSGIGHELLHETVFKKRIVNRILVSIFSIYLWNNWEYHKISHKVHHRSTMITDVDYEFDPKQKPLGIWDIIISLTFNYKYFIRALHFQAQNSLNIVKGPLGEKYISEGTPNRIKVVRAARMILTVHFTVLIISLLFDKIFISILFSLSPFCCNLFSRVLAISQHYKMQVNVKDPRLTSRSIKLPRWIEFLYANMNYHIEHHMYSGIPFYNLPKARQIIMEDIPQPIGLIPTLKLAIKI